MTTTNTIKECWIINVVRDEKNKQTTSQARQIRSSLSCGVKRKAAYHSK